MAEILLSSEFEFPSDMPKEVEQRAVELGVADFAIGAYNGAITSGLNVNDPRTIVDMLNYLERAGKRV